MLLEDGLVSAASGLVPDWLDRSAWREHAPFGSWIVATHRPRTIVELGTHTGFSYLVFCQAIRQFNTGSRAFAVDTWRGDEHAGFYGAEVFEALNIYHAARYGDFSQLIRSTFDEAARHFQDGSIDLLHIDGRHRYEDVRHDFDLWRPKLSQRAVVLLHDTNVRERDFGIARFWSEVTAEHPHFEFFHGHGLGVLAIGDDLSPAIRRLFAATDDDSAAHQVRSIYSRLGASLNDRLDKAETRAAWRSLSVQTSALEQDLRSSKAETEDLRKRLEAALNERETFRLELADKQQHLDAQLQHGEVAREELMRLGERALSLEAHSAQLQAQFSNLSTRLESSRFLGRLVWKKFIHTPRDWSRKYRALRARHRAKGTKLVSTFQGWSAFSDWVVTNEPPISARRLMDGSDFAVRPLISVIIPVYKVSRAVLEATLRSVSKQSYPHWEACIAFGDSENTENWELIRAFAARDARFHPKLLKENLGIAANSNAALDLASGEFVALLDHDDALAPWALHAAVTRINEFPDADFLYSDKDQISEEGSTRSRPLFKPEWSPEILYSANYLTHLNLIRRSVVSSVGGFRPETDGAQDWDLFLRATERSRRVVRIPGILYHWRMVPTSVSTGISAKPYVINAQLRAIQDRLERLGLRARVEIHNRYHFRLRWEPRAWQADIVVNAADADPVQTDRVLSNMEGKRISSLIVVAPSGADSSTFPAGAAKWKDQLVVVPAVDGESPGSKDPLDYGQHSQIVVVVSPEIVRFGESWLEELGDWCAGHSEIAFATAVVCDPTDRVVEAGAAVDEKQRPIPLFRGFNTDAWTIFGTPAWYRNCSAASPWAVAFRREAYDAAGGWPAAATFEEGFVRLCQALRANGNRGVVVPYSRVYLASMPPMRGQQAEAANDPYCHPVFKYALT